MGPPRRSPELDREPFVLGTGPDPTAVMGRRTGAFVLDGLFGLLLTLVAVLAAGGFVEQRGAAGCTQFAGSLCLSLGDGVYTTGSATSWSIVLVPLLYAFAFSIIVQGLTGATPGKALFGLRVVDDQGGGPGLGRAAGRTFFLVIDLIPYCLPLVGLITTFSSTGHRRVGDMVATTFVVDHHDTGRSVVMPITAPAAARHPIPPPAAFTPPAPLVQPPVPARPQWDPVRDTYVLWDTARGCWLAFDQAVGLWREI